MLLNFQYFLKEDNFKTVGTTEKSMGAFSMEKTPIGIELEDCLTVCTNFKL